jgi:hypothetical protein
MNHYEVMINANHKLIMFGAMPDREVSEVFERLMTARSTKAQADRFHSGIRCPGNIDKSGRRMYPEYFIPPYNDGKKLRTIFNQLPNTHILSANMYELEILRLLCKLASDNIEVCDMADKTLERLKTTCFGNADDGVGECFDASLVVLRFLAAASPDDSEWIRSRIDNYDAHADDRKRSWHSLSYFLLCLSEIPFDIAETEMSKHKEQILRRLSDSSFPMNSDIDRIIQPVLCCSLRNFISRFPEFSYIEGRQPYINEKDGRLHFDMSMQGAISMMH